MKISIFFGRGIEGAGVTRYVIELEQALIKQGHVVSVYDLEDRVFLRAGLQALTSTPVTPEELLTFHEKINQTDVLFVASVPSTKHLEESKKNFMIFLENVKVPKVLVQLDHKIESMRRNANWHETCELCDKILTHGSDTPFYRDLILKKGKEQLKKFIQAILIYSPEKLAKFRVPFAEKTRRVLYLGRFATWKDPGRLQLFLTHTNNQENKFLIEMLGVERSISFAQFIYYTDYEKRIRNELVQWKWKLNAEYEAMVPPSLDYIRCWGVYEYNEGMKYAASSLFLASFYHHRKVETFADTIENAMLEMMCSGSVPIFDPTWAHYSHPWRDGKRDPKSFAEQNMFALFLNKDGSNTEEIADEMIRLSQSEKIYTKTSENAYQLAREISDPTWIVPKLLNEIFAGDAPEYQQKIKAEHDIKTFFR